MADVVHGLRSRGCAVEVYDPWLSPTGMHGQHDHGIVPIKTPMEGTYDAIILAVAHRQFKQMGSAGIRRLGKKDALIYDLKYILQPDEADLRL